MPPEQRRRGCAARHYFEEALTFALLDLAADESVRVVEALAAALVNDLRDRPEAAPETWAVDAPAQPGLCEDARPVDEFGRRLALCRRIARRAVRGSLADPTEGANAFHRIEASPSWARPLLPIATYGPYLFYRRSEPDASDRFVSWPAATYHPSRMRGGRPWAIESG
jgi:hypothetical protein